MGVEDTPLLDEDVQALRLAGRGRRVSRLVAVTLASVACCLFGSIALSRGVGVIPGFTGQK